MLREGRPVQTKLRRDWTIFVTLAFKTAQSDFFTGTRPSSDASGDEAHNNPLANLDVVDVVELNSVHYLM